MSLFSEEMNQAIEIWKREYSTSLLNFEDAIY